MFKSVPRTRVPFQPQLSTALRSDSFYLLPSQNDAPESMLLITNLIKYGGILLKLYLPSIVKMSKNHLLSLRTKNDYLYFLKKIYGFVKKKKSV